MATLINGYAYDLRVSALNAHVKWHQQLKKKHQTNTAHNNDRHVE